MTGSKAQLMTLAPTPLNPDHGLDARPTPHDLQRLRQWILRRYAIELPLAEVEDIILDANEASALRHRLRWAFIHGRWVLFLSKNGTSEPQSQECVPVNGSHPYAWTAHVEGRRTPTVVYPGEAWDVDASFAHIIGQGAQTRMYWDVSVEPGFVAWAHARYGLPEAETRALHLTSRRRPPRTHRKLAEIIVGEMSPRALEANHATQLWLNPENLIVNREGREVHIEFIPRATAPKVVAYE
jgi:hypothetical protein